MSKTRYGDLLGRVEKPSRYLGTEVNSIKKDPKRVKLRFALAFPDLYEIGTSHFGMQILYTVLNRRPEIFAERVFCPGVDMERLMKRAAAPLTSLETRRPLAEFDIVGFSLLYELNYTNVLTMLDLAGIPFLSADRREKDPLVVAGGPCSCNPEPVAELFDAVLVGDGESAVLQLADVWMRWQENGGRNRASLLKEWAGIEGVYVPSLFRAATDSSGFTRTVPLKGSGSPVRRAVVPDLNNAPFPDQPIVPFGRPVHDRLRLEISRGCSRGCRFCQAGMIYRPVRERSLETLGALADAAIRSTGYEDLSLLSLSTGDYSGLSPLLSRLMDRCGPDRIAVSLPSFRAGSLTPEMMGRIRQVRKTGFTIAPEAGSQRLRDAINKNLTESEIEQTVTDAFLLGWQVVKLYFMVGLPTETEEDHQALVDLVLRLRSLRRKSTRRGQINVSVATFIPKAHTPFQWAGQISLQRSEQILSALREQLSVPGVQFKWQNPQVSLLEGLWARGDRRLLPLLIRAWQNGCRLDGWSDHFRFDLWQQALEKTGIDIDFFTTRPRSLTEPLPWDHIDMRVSRPYLEAEYNRALSREPTPDCRWGDCSGCGVCDFERIQPVVNRAVAEPDKDAAMCAERGDDADGAWVRVAYEKTGEARFFGHLEMVAIFARAARRAGLSLVHTKGHHPKPRQIFSEPLPVGMESERELFDMQIVNRIDPDRIRRRFNDSLPEGLRVLSVHKLAGKTPLDRANRAHYRVVLSGARFDPDKLDALAAAEALVVSRRRGKGALKKIDLTDMIIDIKITAPAVAQMVLRSEPGRTLRPPEVLEHVFGMGPEMIRSARILKREPR